MVRKALPLDTLRRLRRIAKKANIKVKRKVEDHSREEKLFLRLKSADHRYPDSEFHREIWWDDGHRVRKIKTKKGSVIIKITENKRGPQAEIDYVRKSVDIINKTKPTSFILLKPKAHVIGPFIAMRKTRFPSLLEVVSPTRSTAFTIRGQKILQKIARSNKITEEELREKLRKDFDDLRQIAVNLSAKKPIAQNTYVMRNILFLGIKEGKPIFMPLIDTW